jgi:hypothetical protein
VSSRKCRKILSYCVVEKTTGVATCPQEVAAGSALSLIPFVQVQGRALEDSVAPKEGEWIESLKDTAESGP